ncbi:MAG: DUF1738 domain-containing protein, partial [Armatimonadetes bacterium]|nr:DUF1738 domain-containing protein [Armatimonadota bacterium]
YRGVNTFLLGMQPYTDPRWLTFKQISEKGGKVRRGERSTMVVFWKRWSPPTGEDEKAREIPLLRYFNVFNAEQCEGLSLPSLPAIRTSQNERNGRAEMLVRLMPAPPTIREGGSSAWYLPGSDLVQIPKIEHFSSSDLYYSTLFHELGHATGHESRLNRPGVTSHHRFGSGEYSREELVAELTAAYCGASVGLDDSLVQDSASYIDGWLTVLGDDPKAMVVAAAQAQRAADCIAGKTEIRANYKS